MEFQTLPTPKFSLVESVEELERLLAPVMNGNVLMSFDIETGYLGEPRDGFSLHPETNFVVGFSFCYDLGWAVYVPLGHDLYEGNLNSKEVAPILWQVLQTGMGIAANAKFELRNLAKFFTVYLSDHPLYGAQVRESKGYYPIKGDTFLMAYCVGEFKEYGLKFLTKQMYGYDQTVLEDLFPGMAKNKKKTLRFNTLELTKEVIDYACDDSYWTLRQYHDIPKLTATSMDDAHLRHQRFEAIYQLELNTIRSVCAMEDFGIAVDWGMIKKAAYEGKHFKDKLNLEIQSELSEMLNEQVDINLTSPKQMSELLFDKLKLTTNRYTKSTKNLPSSQRKMSTDEQTLVTLSNRMPLLKKVVQWREMKTLLTRYLTNYERDYSFAEDGKLHPDLWAAGTITGRFSAAHPNYQQLPKRYYFKLNEAKQVDEEHEAAHGDRFPIRDEKPWRGIEVECDCGEFPYPEGSVFDFNFREAIIAPEGYRILGFDLSQAELRAIAGEANEPAMLDAFRSGEDVHKKTAALLLRKPIEQVTKKEREVRGKALADDELVLTPRGWSRMGDMWVGDEVVIPNGEVATVSGVFPQGDRHLYRVCFDDGTSVEADGAHRWAVTDSHNGEEKILTTDDIRALGVHDGLPYRSTPRWSIPAVYTLYFEWVDLPVDPYDKGCYLGELGSDSTRSIPNEYMFSSIEQRLDLLNGLMDVAGSTEAGEAYFVFPSHQLAEDIAFVVRSLGGKASIDMTRVWMQLPKGMNPFRLDSKAVEYVDGGDLDKWIISMEPSRVASATCILVDDVDHQFITTGVTRTMNTLNFALSYGLSAKSLGERLGLSEQEANELFNEYYRIYPNIKVWQDRQIALGQSHGFVYTKFGRRIPLWDLESNKRWVRSKADRVAINGPIQGGATGDLVKIAMTNIHDALWNSKFRDTVHMVMNIHDALEFYVRDDVDINEVYALLKPIVEREVDGWAPVVAEWHVGQRWGSVVELKDVDGKLVPTGEVKKVEDFPELEPEPTVDEPEQPEPVEMGEARTVIIELGTMPTRQQYTDFVVLATSRPGNNKVQISLNDGRLKVDVATRLSPKDQQEISMIFKGAKVSYAADKVDKSNFLKAVGL